MTERSGNEIYAMVLRAGRGAGLPLANAQDIAAACRWLSGNLRPVVDALNTGETKNSVASAGPPVIDMALAHPGQPQNLPDGVKTSDLIVALCNEASVRNGCAIVVDAASPALTITATAGTPPNPPARARAVVEPAEWDTLADFAARTYVPESDASRLSGAGAGLTDND